MGADPSTTEQDESNTNHGTARISSILIAVVQGFGIFVAISLISGRIYLLEFFRTLGIPVSSISLSPVDTILLSPDTAVLSVMISLSFPSAVALFEIGRRHSEVLPIWVESKKAQSSILGVGIVVILLLNFLYKSPYPWAVLLVGICLLTLGSYYGLAAGYDFVNRKIGVTQVLLTFGLIVAYAFLLITFPSILGKSNADLHVCTAPKASIEFTQGSGPITLIDQNVPIQSASIPIRIIWVTDDFTFVSKTNSTKDGLFAIHNDDISGFKTISDSSQHSENILMRLLGIDRCREE